ncbi:MAG: hypothetical protein IJW63_03220 [Lachnospiraceae bacterium]|nr:hypothetical protein [Lachnospiraceae bacterium]
MKKTLKRLSALLLSVLMLVGSFMTASAEEGYTYNYDWWGDVQYSPDAYRTVGVYTATDLGLDKNFNQAEGMFVCGNRIYVCDTGNNRIIEFERTDTESIELVRIIDEIKGNVEVKTFNFPSDISVTEDGFMYICDQNNGRILKLDMDLNYISEITKPTDPNFDQDLNFLPDKICVDTAGRVYCIAVNVNKGTIKFETDGTFAGFVGATPVTYNFMDYVWKKLSTKAQREQLASFVPTEYDNVYMDHEGFIYAVTSNVSETDLDAGTANPIRRLNMMGNDILVRNGNWFILGDLYWGEGGGYEGPSLMTDITAFDNDIYVAIDRTRGRLFAYDDQGRMLFAFGGNGNMDGYFKSPTALDHMGRDLLVLDSVDASITIFTPTTFGNLIYDAIEQFQNGLYEESGETWKEVMKLNGNYDLAYVGIGRALLRQKEYKEAMEYFELKWDDENYSRAFKQYRKIWVEENIFWIVVALFMVLCVPLMVGKVRKVKWEIDTADIFKE